MRTLILLIAVVLILYIARHFWRKKGLSGKQISQKFVLYGLSAALVLLMLTGRVNWVMGALGAALPILARFLPLIRYMPLLGNLYRRFQQNQSAPGSAAGNQTSSVQSRYLRMILNHASGEMDGEILAGRLQGRKLSELPVEQLTELLSEFSADQDSLALLQTYLDRVHSDWRDHVGGFYSGEGAGADADSSRNAATSGQMSAQEAREILGVAQLASKDEIVEAHRRLMQKLHPDRGGSSYLAAKINQAKDLLLKNAQQ